MKRATNLFMTITVASAAACGGGGQANNQNASDNAASPAATSAPANTAAGSQAARQPARMPDVLSKAESAAEDIQDDIAGGSWSAASGKVDTLANLQSRIAATGPAQNDLDAYATALDTLRAAVQQQRRNQALTSANRMSRALNGMMEAYPTRVPIDVAYMDVAGRDVIYDAQEGQWSQADSAVSELRQRYSAVKSHVTLADASLDQRITGEISRLQSAVSAHNLGPAKSVATAILDDVDRIEQTY